MAILAAGVGFGIRGAIFGTWESVFKFTALEVGLIGGAGFTGFCFAIMIGGVVVDKIGYGKLVVAAFLFHVISAVIALFVSDHMDPKTAFALLWTSTFIFSMANGTLEAVANPLVATIFPHARAHYLNILHASWPAGMVIGGLAATFFGGSLHWTWQNQLILFLAPTVLYGVMFFGQKFPKSEASERGLTLGQMLKDVGVLGAVIIGLFIGLFVKDGLGPLLNGFTKNPFFIGQSWTYLSTAIGVIAWLTFSNLSGWARGAWLLFILLITHALIGAVELGTDSWIQNVTGNILTPKQGTYLFIFTSMIMFGLRFCAQFIEKNLKFSPIGLLLICSIIACIGLNFVSAISTFGGAFGALAVYALGKTFFWPTMLAIASDRFPRTGAVAISIMGGIGMMSAGLIGSAGLGYAKDRFTAESLPQELHGEYMGTKTSKWLFFEQVTTVDAEKTAAINKTIAGNLKELEAAGDPDAAKKAVAALPENERRAHETDVTGSRLTLKADSAIPAIMAIIFLCLLIYFKSIGGYKVLHISAEDAAGGVNGPVR
jgi:DHA2 family metal-tetracycline-proton antiporter-like MFS transporter